MAEDAHSNRAWQAKDVSTSCEHLVLDERERCIRGVSMTPLLGGEFRLLSYLGERSPTWHSTHALSLLVYNRADAAGRQLVWKYASTLRKKLAVTHPELIELCRRRGYRCSKHVLTLPLTD